MPLYTFTCPRCGHTQDIPLTIDERDRVKVKCRKCACNRMERVKTAASFVITGFNAKNRYSR